MQAACSLANAGGQGINSATTLYLPTVNENEVRVAWVAQMNQLPIAMKGAGALHPSY